MNDVQIVINHLLASNQTINCEEKTAAIEYIKSAWPQIMARAASTPRFVCIAGIPGSGKSEYIRKQCLSESFVVVDPDHYRKYAPRYDSFSSDNVVKNTKTFVDYLSTLIIGVAICAKSSICIPSTFCATHFWVTYLKSIALYVDENNYTTELLILTQPNNLSFQSFIKRSDSSTDDEPIARKADISFFHNASQCFDRGIHELIRTGFFSSVSLLTRTSLDQDYALNNEEQLNSFCLQGDGKINDFL